MTGIPFATAAFLFWAQNNSSTRNTHKSAAESFRASNKCSTNTVMTSLSSVITATSITNTENDDDDDEGIRCFRTPADRFYKENNKIPPPSLAHATLAELSAAAATEHEEPKTGDNYVNKNEKKKKNINNSKNILVIGDVHGCYDELLELHAKAMMENDSMNFQYVILVGDLCNKGPESAKVIRHVRLNPGWFSVRGNHDDGALAAALGDTTRLQKKTYQWVVRDNGQSVDDDEDDDDDEESKLNRTHNVTTLSDNDVHWLSQLPYTIQIPGEFLGEDEDTLIVHAGLIPNCEIEDQKITTMTTIRDLLPRCNEDGNFTHFEYHNNKGGDPVKAANIIEAADDDDDAHVYCNEAVTWASAWNGPQRVIFGHDARRKLQLHPGNWATGLDTGAVYGGELTGIILPERKLVSVKSKEYSPI